MNQPNQSQSSTAFSRSREIPTGGERPGFSRSNGGSGSGRGSQTGSYTAPSRFNRGGTSWDAPMSGGSLAGSQMDYQPLTEAGYEFPFKKALLARWNPHAQLPSDVMRRIEASDSLVRDFWIASPQRPVSFEPFVEEEHKAIATGQFCAASKRPAGGPAGKGGNHHHHHHSPQQQRDQPQRGHTRANKTEASNPAATHSIPTESHPDFLRTPQAVEVAASTTAVTATNATITTASIATNSSGSNQPELYEYYNRRERAPIVSDRAPGKSLMTTLRRKGERPHSSFLSPSSPCLPDFVEMEAERTMEAALEERFNAPLNQKKNVDPLLTESKLTHQSKIGCDLSDLEDDFIQWAESTESHFGHFDSNGKFVTTPSAFVAEPANATCHPGYSQASPSYLRAQQQTWQSSSSASLPNRTSGLELSPGSGPLGSVVVPPTITNTTRWVYRDPSGQIQGPFPNAKMLEWYNRQYFPENLPLKREEDFDFESLGAWKQKCQMAPFLTPMSAQTIQPSPPAPPPTTPSGASSTASPLAKFFDLNITIPSQTLSGPNQPLVSPAITPVVPKALNEEEANFLSQFGLGKKPSIVPSAASASSHQSENVERIQQQIKNIALQEQPKQQKPEPHPFQQKQGWESAQRATPIDLAQAVYRKPSAVDETSNYVPSKPKAQQALQSASWSKPVAPVKSLEEILKEEEAAARKPPNTSGRKSFADLMKAAEAIPVLQPIQSATTPVAVPMSRNPAQQAKGSPLSTSPKPISQVFGQVKMPKGQQYDPLGEVREWSRLALRPLTPLYDIETCTGLLMEMANPEELASFVRANLRTDRIDVEDFLVQLIGKRFGQVAASKFMEEQEEFITVDRRQKSKK